MKRGFTLIEILAVIVILTLIMGISIPAIVNSVNNKRDEVSDVSKQIIYSAADIYISETGESSCIKLEQLVDSGKLVSPLKDLETGKEIPLNYYVKIVNGEHSIVSNCP